MAIRIERLSPDQLPAVRQLRESQFTDATCGGLSEDYYRWRYTAREQSETLLAFDGERCVAMLDSSSHSYRFGDSAIRVREPCEWLCLPEYRPQGLGLRLMGTFMQEPEPMFAMVGTWMTQDILPRMGWKKLPDTTNYTLLLTSGAYAESLLGRLRVPGGGFRSRLAHTISFPTWHRRSKKPRADIMLSEHLPGDPFPLVEPSSDYALACISSEWEPGWLDSAPQDMGRFFWLVGHSGGRPVGLTISRLFRRHGNWQASLLHVQACERSSELYEWLITETSRFLAMRGATKVLCRASCQVYSAALERTGFVERSRTPAFWWSKDKTIPIGPIHLTQWRADELIRPYPTS